MRDFNVRELLLHTAKTHSSDVKAGTEGKEVLGSIDVTNDEIDQVVTRSRELAASDRLGTHGHVYIARLQECLRAEFPILSHALGENLFRLFTFDYLKQYPSRSYTIKRLAENFNLYLTESLTNNDAPGDSTEGWRDFILDLAAMERAFNDVFDGPGVEGHQVLDANQSIQTTNRFMETRFLSVVCLKLLAFRYPVSRYFTAVRNNEAPTFPKAAETFLVMTRRDYIVRIHELTQVQYEVLSALVAGQTLSQVVNSIAKATDPNFRTLTSTLFAWINDWAEKGFFAGIER
jgi:hypothetical protein